jgi:hypothetical protein
MTMRDRRDSGDEFWDNLSKQIDEEGEHEDSSGGPQSTSAPLETVTEVTLRTQDTADSFSDRKCLCLWLLRN